MKAVAEEARLGRHLLTQQHTDIERFIKLIASDNRASKGKAADPTVVRLRQELLEEKAKNAVLAGQISVLLAAQELQDGPASIQLRSV